MSFTRQVEIFKVHEHREVHLQAARHSAACGGDPPSGPPLSPSTDDPSLCASRASPRMGLITEEGTLLPDYDWTAERYAHEFGRAAK